ncbi:hypothetical protein HCK00_24605 [Streptomyces sp. PLAI1-29]|uniref:Peptidoglycan-binding protein n=1 Tax=Streptomyces zingiberis TaxID=2053010 RepID=A0ABX1C484_9ACTN|nr:hypothetical protein [Streptomyces zingiberis]NJQ03611.1 hypothetical protein [Streptomyces zingiberis]
MKRTALLATAASTLALATVLGTQAAATAAPVSAAPAAAPAAEQAAAVTKLTHSQATTRLRNAGVSWTSSGGCSNRNQSNCTSFEQVNLATIQGAETLKSASGCALTITGGTETGHASGTYSHWNGYKLDYSLSTCVNNYVTGNFTYIGTRSDGAAQYRSGAGNIYAKEGNHWDVLYYNCGGC